jgi:hypothetical protein
MASSFTLYGSFRKYALDGTINLDTDTIKLMLVTSDYTPDLAHTVLADINASPDPEVVAVASPSNGYTKGGQALTGQAVTNSTTAGKFDADDLTFSALTATFRYGILYAEKSIGSPAIVNPLIGYILFNTTPADVVVSGVDWLCQWSANGIITS